MARETEIVLPDLGEGQDGVIEATVSCWSVEIGDLLEEGDDLMEIVTDKASFVVPSPVQGRLLKKCVEEDDPVHVGDVVAIVTTEEARS